MFTDSWCRRVRHVHMKVIVQSEVLAAALSLISMSPHSSQIKIPQRAVYLVLEKKFSIFSGIVVV